MNELTDKIILNILSEVSRTSLKGLFGSIKWMFTKSKRLALCSIAAKKYTSRIAEVYGFTRIFGDTHPIPLAKIFVKVRVSHVIENRRILTVEQLNKQNNQNDDDKDLSLSGLDIINRYDRLVLLGRPGAGKTTFLKALLLDCVNGNLEKKYLPVLISLYEYSKCNLELIEFIKKELSICGFSDIGYNSDNILNSGKIFILLDGLDEISYGQEDKIVFEITRLTKQYPNNKYIISCRDAGYRNWFPDFVDIALTEFNEDQILAFVSNWFIDKCSIDKFWDDVKCNQQRIELAKNPLLLSLLCLVYKSLGRFPMNRIELYEYGIDVLLSKWDESKNVRQEKRYKLLPVSKKKEILRKIAFDAFIRKETYFKKPQILTSISKYFTQTNDESNFGVIDDYDDFLSIMQVQHGLIVERAREVYSFSHLTFQEFFIAYFIEFDLDPDESTSIIAKHLLDPSYSEIFIMIKEMEEVKKTNFRLQQGIFKQVDFYYNVQDLSALSNQINLLVDNKNVYNITINKTIALLYVLYFTIEEQKFKSSYIKQLGLLEITLEILIHLDEIYGYNLKTYIKYANQALHERKLVINKISSSVIVRNRAYKGFYNCIEIDKIINLLITKEQKWQTPLASILIHDVSLSLEILYNYLKHFLKLFESMKDTSGIIKYILPGILESFLNNPDKTNNIYGVEIKN